MTQSSSLFDEMGEEVGEGVGTAGDRSVLLSRSEKFHGCLGLWGRGRLFQVLIPIVEF